MSLQNSEILLNNLINTEVLKITQLLDNFGFKIVAIEDDVLDDNGNVIGELDIIATFEEHIFFFEITTQKTKIKEKANFWFSRFSEDDIILLVINKHKLPRKKVIRIFIDLSHKRGQINLASLNQSLKNKNNKYLFFDDIEYFMDNYQHIGKVTRNDFFYFIDLPRTSKYEEINAIKFFIDKIPAYSFIAPVEGLLEVCYVMRKYDGEGYQRALNYNRIKAIAKYINIEDIIAFPNSILLNSESKISTDNIPMEECPCPVKIRFPLNYLEFRVVDGQHRLLGFAQVDDVRIKNSFLPVIAFEKMPPQKELKMFIDINSKQKKVDPNLVLLLKKEFPWKPHEKEYYEKIAVEISIKLNEKGPLKEKIYLGTAREKSKKEKVSLRTMVSILTKNAFLREKNAIWQNKYSDIKTPYNNTNNIIISINKHLKEYILKGKPFFLDNIGLRIIFRLIRIIEQNRHNKNIKISNEEVIKDINIILNPVIFEELQSSYGEGGANYIAYRLCNELKLHNPKKYSKLETNLKKIPFIKKAKK